MRSEEGSKILSKNEYLQVLQFSVAILGSMVFLFSIRIWGSRVFLRYSVLVPFHYPVLVSFHYSILVAVGIYFVPLKLEY